MQLTLTAEEEILNLKKSVALANDYAGYESSWKRKRYGPDEAVQFRRLLHALSEWRRDRSRNVVWMKLEHGDREALERYTKKIRITVQPNGAYCIDDLSLTPWNEALFQFIQLLNNNQVELLGGPCRNRKKHENRDFWFMRATRRPSVYCSRLCAANATKASEREKIRSRKIEKAQRALKNYPNRPTRFRKLDWKQFVTQAEPSISKKFLTLAVEGGHLVPPTNPKKA